MKTADPCPRSWLTNAATLSDNTERWVELHLISIWWHGLVDRLRSLAAIERDQWGESLHALWFIYLMFGPAGGREGIYWNTKPYTLPGSNSLENKDLRCIGGPEIYCIHWPLLKKTSPDGGQTGSISCATVTCTENVDIFRSRPQGVEGLWGGKKCRWWNRTPQTPLKH